MGFNRGKQSKRGKQKYKDVVKSNNTNKKVKPPRKTYTLVGHGKVKCNNNTRRNKRKNEREYKAEIKRPKIEMPPESSSESEEDVNYIQKICETLGDTSYKKRLEAIETSDDSSSDGENIAKDDHEDINNTNEISEAKHVDDRETEARGYVRNQIESSSDDENNQIENEDNTNISDTKPVEEIVKVEATDDVENLEDPFLKHLNYGLSNNFLLMLQQTPVVVDTLWENWDRLGKVLIEIPKCEEVQHIQKTLLGEERFTLPGKVPAVFEPAKDKFDDLFIKPQIKDNLVKANKCLADPTNTAHCFTPLQNEVFSILNNYQDFYFPERTFDNADELRFVYCVHLVNHILKTRSKIIHHNAKLSNKDDVPEDFRDQGLVRPKILVLVPFRNSAYKIIQTIIDILMPDDKGNVINKTRFTNDFTGNEIVLPKKHPKPEDYEQTFTGNIGDDFKIGISVTKKSIKLYADFYSSDIIVASPLGLRLTIGSEGEPDRDFDFLASIEMLILDQAEIFSMQNLLHLFHVLEHMHLKPRDTHGSDWTRARLWSLDGHSKYYRQTLIFSSTILPEIKSIFYTNCFNYAGRVSVVNQIKFGAVNQVWVKLPHDFRKFGASSLQHSCDARFDFFTNEILTGLKDEMFEQTLIYVPSYYDFVLLRNHFKKEDIGFVQICEYTKEAKVARARDMFFHGDAHFMLYTERYHFYNRIRVKGIRHLVFYQPPSVPHFYSEMCNLMREANMNRKIGSNLHMTVTVIYSEYDVIQLASVIGTERALKLVQSDRNVHTIET